MGQMSDAARFEVGGYEGFRARARDSRLTANEKSGFPECLRAGRSGIIFEDLCAKLSGLTEPSSRILDIGPGCGELAHYMVDACARNRSHLTLIDSPEMLELLPDSPHIEKVPGPFPECLQRPGSAVGPFDAILAYSVFQYVFADRSAFAFVDTAIQLLTDKGEFLIGDIPNATMRKRFLASPTGQTHHQQHYPDRPPPTLTFNSPEPGAIDDAVVLGIVARVRAAGLHAFIVPQARALPMANRREDILIRRP
jgi:hypothetical protein